MGVDDRGLAPAGPADAGDLLAPWCGDADAECFSLSSLMAAIEGFSSRGGGSDPAPGVPGGGGRPPASEEGVEVGGGSNGRCCCCCCWAARAWRPLMAAAALTFGRLLMAPGWPARERMLAAETGGIPGMPAAPARPGGRPLGGIPGGMPGMLLPAVACCGTEWKIV